MLEITFAKIYKICESLSCKIDTRSIIIHLDLTLSRRVTRTTGHITWGQL